jgi:hypothetical protein
MKVKELIEQLQTIDPELYVFTKGYEGGYNDANPIGPVMEIALDVNRDWYYGSHEVVDHSLIGPSHSFEIVKGIIL